IYPDPSPCLSDNSVDCGQAQPGAGAYWFGGKERLKDSLLNFGCHAGAAVGDCEHDVSARSNLRVPGCIDIIELAVVGLKDEGAALRHGIPAVDRKVDNHLLDLAGIRRQIA